MVERNILTCLLLRIERLRRHVCEGTAGECILLRRARVESGWRRWLPLGFERLRFLDIMVVDKVRSSCR